MKHKKSRPWQTSHKLKSVKDGMENLIYLITRGATLLHEIFRCDTDVPCSFRNTNIFPATDVCPHVAEYSAIRLLTAPSAVHLTSCVLTVLSIPSLCKCTICFYLRFNGFKQCFILNFLYFTSMPSYCQLVFRFIFFCFSHSFTGIYFLTANHFFVRCSIPAARFLVLPAGPVPEPG